MKLSTIADITAASFLGMFLGASIGGRLSDRIGRKKALNCFVLVFSISSAPMLNQRRSHVAERKQISEIEKIDDSESG